VPQPTRVSKASTAVSAMESRMCMSTPLKVGRTLGQLPRSVKRPRTCATLRPMRYRGPIFRPPSEADSYILQIAYGCSWNGCTF
jgi:hypothetical protein